MGVFSRGWRAVCAPVVAVVLVSCGGGGGDSAEPAGCDVASQKGWLRGYMSDWYYWSGASPDPDPAGYGTVASYFDALRYTGSGNVPADRWSYIEDSATYSQFFEEGRTLGYGVFVNGLEMVLPLKLRYVEPQSPAAAAGLKRGDVIVSINGRSAAELMASGDFAALTPADEGEVLNVVVEQGAGTRSLALTAATYDLTPVSVAKVLPLPDGRKAGYLVLKDFITQAEAPLAEAFAQFRAEGVTELILDLRYNGGGRVSTSGVLASLVAGAGHAGGVFARLTYNDRHRDADQVYSLASAPGPALQRVVILTGPRTCSASELVVNGLKPFVDVVTIGDATCGKPFGFSPAESCGSTFSAVNFESFNGEGAGGYYDGIAQTCAAEDDFSGEFGDAQETLTAAATDYLDTGVCAPVAAARDRTAAAVRLRAQRGPEPGDRQGMIAD